ncbi:hypothetical protein GCM10022222_83160 [Amycolatopsis ultiminotia]|uniref:Secreted protein n=1 Tax=Amycolatopsis ultiminotia TaxID=543629 RepID=A0ABP6YL42_9PSEU
MGVMGMKRGVITGAVAGALLVAAGGTAVAFAQGDAPAVSEAAAKPAASADVNGKSEGSVTTGDYYVWLLEANDKGEGLGTGIPPHTTQDLKSLHWDSGDFTPTTLRFSVGKDSDGPDVASYPVPAPGKFVACTATGTEADPNIQCVVR